MDAWIVWVVVACILGFGEMHTGALYLLPFAIGAAVAAVVSVLGVGALLAVLIFVLASALMFGALRPVARRHRRLPPAIRTGAAALIGRRAMVLERIANNEGVGCVKIEGGEVWTARSYDQDAVIDGRERVEGLKLRGVSVL